MLIFLAGLDLSHLQSNSKYTQAAGIQGSVLMSFFQYSDPSSHASKSTFLIPQLTKDDHDRQVNDES